MMKYINIIFLLMLSLSMAQCSSDDEPVLPRPEWNALPEDFANGNPNWSAAQDATAAAPAWAVDLTGNYAAPAWTDPDKSVYPTSMTAVVRLTPVLEYFAADDDAMAAFIGGECRGVAQAVMSGGVKLFFIQVKAPSSESGNVEFRYYSSRHGRIYKSVASDVKYLINKVYGTADAPEYPDFEQSGKYPCIGKAFVNIDAAKLPFEVRNDDEIAVIIDDECRSIAHADNGSLWFDIFGAKQGEEFRFKYYSAATKCTYTSEQSFVMPADGGAVGSAESPEALTFVPSGSMTAYVSIASPLNRYADSAADVVAAFADGKCLGVGECIDNLTYKLVIRGLVAEGASVDVKYYNSKCDYIFTVPAFISFANTSVVGSQAQPKSLDINLTGKHPLRMNVCVTPKGVLESLACEADVVAAFVGDECRGVGRVKFNGSKQAVCMVTVNGSIEGSEYVTLKFYSSVAKRLYESSRVLPFVGGSDYGVEVLPEALEFVEK